MPPDSLRGPLADGLRGLYSAGEQLPKALVRTASAATAPALGAASRRHPTVTQGQVARPGRAGG